MAFGAQIEAMQNVLLTKYNIMCMTMDTSVSWSLSHRHQSAYARNLAGWHLYISLLTDKFGDRPNRLYVDLYALAASNNCQSLCPPGLSSVDQTIGASRRAE
jgi:hypothetical protein